MAPIEEFPVEKWDVIIAINLSAAFHAIRAAVPAMKARKWGRIINTASAHSLVASPFKVAYVAAKHGLAGLTKTVALEVATFGITVNCICPGYVWTPLVEKQIPDTMKARGMTEEQVKRDVMLAAQPTKQFVTVEEVAALALYLCSRRGRRDHRRQSARSTAAGPRSEEFVDGALPGRAERTPARPSHHSGAAGRRRARRLHLGRARPLLEDGRLDIEAISGTAPAR